MTWLEHLKGDITQLQQEAAQETARKQEEARRKAQLAEEEERRIEPNWNLVKQYTLDIFRELNRKVLNSRGEIVGWRTVDSNYQDTVTTHVSQGYGDSDNKETYTIEEKVEVAELRVEGLGSVFASRVLEGKSTLPSPGGGIIFDWKFLSFKDEYPAQTSHYGTSQDCVIGQNHVSLKEPDPKNLREKIIKAVSEELKDLYLEFYRKQK